MRVFDHIDSIHRIKILIHDQDVVVSPKNANIQYKIVLNKFYHTDSTSSGSFAVASHRFIKIKIFGFDKRCATLCKNFFS